MSTANGFQEYGYKACDASRLSVEDIEKTSVLVANELRNQMPRSLDFSLIPFPGPWLSAVFPNIPYAIGTLLLFGY